MDVFFRNKLALTNEEIQDRVKEFEDLNVKLKDDLKDASQQLLARGNELVKSKAELQSHRMEIDVSRLRGEICFQYSIKSALIVCCLMCVTIQSSYVI